jgi:threonine/homoserine/homoserine lactone efflux protein
MLELPAAAATLGLSGGLSPGPLLALVVTETMARGRSAGLAVAAAPLLTDGPIIAVTILLLNRIEDSQSALGALSLVGAGLLASYGVAALRAAEIQLDQLEAEPRVWQALAKGVLANLLNPSPYLFWLAIGTPLLLRAHRIGLLTAIGFLAVFYTALVGSKGLLAVLVSRSREVLQGRAMVWINRLLGLLLIAYAVVFIRRGLDLLAAG